MNKITLLILTFTSILLGSCVKQRDCVCIDSTGNSTITGSIKTNSSRRLTQFDKDCKLSSVDYYNNGVYSGSTQCSPK